MSCLHSPHAKPICLQVALSSAAVQATPALADFQQDQSLPPAQLICQTACLQIHHCAAPVWTPVADQRSRLGCRLPGPKASGCDQPSPAEAGALQAGQGYQGQVAAGGLPRTGLQHPGPLQGGGSGDLLSKPCKRGKLSQPPAFRASSVEGFWQCSSAVKRVKLTTCVSRVGCTSGSNSFQVLFTRGVLAMLICSHACASSSPHVFRAVAADQAATAAQPAPG